MLDGMALAYRAYFAFITNPLKNSKGENTSAVYGFTNTLIKILDEEKPEYIAVAFDTPQPTFRHQQYQAYKATREKMPEDMSPQLPLLKQITEAMGVPVIELPGFEADDIIGTLATTAKAKGLHAFMVTGDKDFMQLVADKVTMYNPLKKGVDKEILDPTGVREKMGVGPEQIPDLLGLMGDSTDNIPGVKGVGEKTALKLIQEYGSIDGLYGKIEDVKGKIRENLAADREKALLSRQLATIRTDAPLNVDLRALKRGPIDRDRLHRLLYDLEFNSFIQRILGDSPAPETASEKPHVEFHVTVVDDERAVNSCLANLLKASNVAIDMALAGEGPMTAEVRGIGLCDDQGHAYYLPCHSPEEASVRISALRPFWETGSIKKAGHNIKTNAIVLLRHGVRLAGTEYDTEIAAHLLNSERSTGLETVVRQYLDDHTAVEGPQIPSNSDRAATVYGQRAMAIARVRHSMNKNLNETGSDRVFQDVEVPLIEVLARMEYNGVWLNMDILSEMSREFGEKIKNVEQIAFHEAGTKFNLNSPQQLGELLFDRLQIHKLAGIEKPRRTGKTRQYATDAKILDMYKGLPVVDAILNYRQLTKLKSTYIDGLPPLLNTHTNRIHSTFSQTIAATGRLSSSNPNFQNIPVRTDMGREIRRAFAAEKSGWILLSADYSQIELRVVAHMSEDENLIAAFHQNADIHTSTAMRVFGLTEKEVTKELRRKAKDINFGIMYGISPFGLASRIGMSQSDARDFIANYFEKFPKVKNLIDRIVGDGRANGYVTTLFGRRRYLPDLQSKNYAVRQMAERAATNAPIQGTAAELIKIAMIRIHEAMQKAKLASKIILQVHDELVFEVPQEEASTMGHLVVSNMEHAAELRVPLKVDVGLGDNWLELK